jgi:uncharacterized protein YjbI with pentapeptide repeats
MDVFAHQREYDGQTFRNLIVHDQTVEFKEFDECVFKSCAFLETRFRGCRFLNCTFQACDLNLIHVDGCSFAETSFHQSKVIGVNWTDASWSKQGLLNSVHFSDCVINHSTFMGLQLKNMRLTGCIAKNVDFSEADLTLADCSHTDFSQSRFFHTNLTKADFREAKNYAIAAHLNTLKQAKFSLPEAMSLLYGLDIILK